MKYTNWCFVGAGRIANKVGKELLTLPNHKIVSIYNRTKERGEAFASNFNCTYYSDFLSAINDSRVDIVYIALTNEQHYKFAKLCLQNHKALLLEKPLTTNARQTKELIELARKNNVFFAEAMWTWYNKIPLEIKRIVGNKELGDIKEVNYKFHPDMGDWKSITRLVELSYNGGALLDLGVYQVRYIYELFGLPNKIVAKAEMYNGIDKSDKIDFIYDDFVAHIDVAIDQNDGEILEIKGSKSSIIAKDVHMSRYMKYKEEITDTSYRYANMLDSVATSYHNGEKESIVSLDSSLDVMEILDEIRRQIGLIYLED